MVSRNFLCLFSLVLSVAAAQEPGAVTRLIGNAIERNQELQALRQRIAEAEALLRQAGLRLVPTLEAEAASGRPLGTRGEEQYSAGLFYPLETAGKREKRMEVASQSVALARAEFDERARLLAYEVETRFAEATAEQRRASALERILDSTRQSLRLIEARVAEGDAAPLEKQLLAVDLNRVEAQQAAVAGRSQAALLDLEALTGVHSTPAPSAAGGLPADPREPSIEELKRRALDRRPDLRAARFLEAQGAAETRLAEAQARPNLTLSAKYARRNAQFDAYGFNGAGQSVPLRDHDNIVSFGVSVPLTSRNRNLGNVQAASAREAGARLRREHLERTIPLEIEAAWRRWESARRAAGLIGSAVLGQSERNLEVMRQAYSLGQLRMLDVLNEQRRVIDIEMAHIDAAAEAARALAGLRRAVGGELP